MTIIKQIKAEIERLAKRADRRTDKDHASHNAEMERYGEDYWNGYGDLAYALLSFLSTLESEKPMNLEEEISRYLREECSGDDEPSISEIARHFAQWGAEHLADNKVVSLKLGDEIAINGYKLVYDKNENAIRVAKVEPNGSSEDLGEAADEYEKKHTYQRYDGGGLTPEYNATLAEAVIFGAKWQKEQMMKEAVEGTYAVTSFGHSAFFPDKPIKDLCFGDKVRIIVCKNED